LADRLSFLIGRVVGSYISRSPVLRSGYVIVGIQLGPVLSGRNGVRHAVDHDISRAREGHTLIRSAPWPQIVGVEASLRCRQVVPVVVFARDHERSGAPYGAERAAEAPLIESARATVLSTELGAVVSLPQHDVHDTADRIGAVDARAAVGQNLHAIDRGSGDDRRIEELGLRAGHR